MKTNTKRVINILLTLVMLFSIATAMGSVALAAPVVSSITASYADDIVTIAFDGVETDGLFASLRIWPLDDLTETIYINQYLFVEGANEIEAFVDGEDWKGLVVKATVAFQGGTFSVNVGINVDKSILADLLENAPFEDEDLCYADTWEIFWEAYEDGLAALENFSLSQIEVDEVVETLIAAIEQLRYYATSLVIESPALTTVIRNQTYTFEVTPYAKGTAIADIEWTIANPLYAVIKGDKITILNKTGTVILTATDLATGVKTFITLRIV